MTEVRAEVRTVGPEDRHLPVALAVGDGVDAPGTAGQVVEGVEPELVGILRNHPGLSLRQAMFGAVADDLDEVVLQVPDAVPLLRLVMNPLVQTFEPLPQTRPQGLKMLS